jgi:general stress protein YciG
MATRGGKFIEQVGRARRRRRSRCAARGTGEPCSSSVRPPGAVEMDAIPSMPAPEGPKLALALEYRPRAAVYSGGAENAEDEDKEVLGEIGQKGGQP